MTRAELHPARLSAPWLVGSLVVLGVAMLGGTTRVVCPPGYEPRADYIEACGDSVTITSDLDGVDGADVLYTDVWTSMGQEAETAQRLESFGPYIVDESLFARAKDSAIFLHCLPAHRGEEVTDGVMDHERSRVFDQAENRLHAIKALLLELVE